MPMLESTSATAIGPAFLAWAASHILTLNAPGHSPFIHITSCMARRWEETTRLAMLSRSSGALGSLRPDQ